MALPKPGDHRRDFHGKFDEYRTSALFDLNKLPSPSFVRFQTAVEKCFISHLFHIISRGKVRPNALSTTFKPGQHFDAKNWAFDAKFAEIERGQTVVRFWQVNKLHSLTIQRNKHRQ